MKSIHLVRDGREVPLLLPAPNALVLLADEQVCRKRCKVPVHVVGIRPLVAVTHDTTEVEARCYECNRSIGLLRIRWSTVFGVAEDQAFLSTARPRIYDGTGLPFEAEEDESLEGT